MFDKPFYHLIFCPPLRVMYCPIPKAACSSIKAYLREQMGMPATENLSVLHGRQNNLFVYAQAIEREELIQILFSERAGYFKFTVCRNPYTRLVSAYNDLVSGSPEKAPRGSAIAEALRLDYCGSHNMRPSDVPYLSFDMFIRAIQHHKPATLDRHWQLQSVLSCSNIVKYDMIIKIEELAKKTEALAEAAKLSKPLSYNLNIGPERVKSTRDCYTEELRKIVADVYARDFKRFRYDPDDVPDE